MTLLASSNIIMSARHNRWLSLKEILTVQGLHVNCQATHGVPCGSYALRDFLAREGVPYTPWPSHRAACQQAGNSMHVSVAGVVLLFALTQIAMDPGMLKLQLLEVRRALAMSMSPKNEKKPYLRCFNFSPQSSSSSDAGAGL